MNENIIEAKYNITKKSKINIFYNKYKILIYISSTIVFITILSLLFYDNYKENKKIKLADDYFKAKIYIQNNQNDKAITILNKVIFANDSTYSSLALFLIVNENLETNKEEVIKLFKHVLENNKFDDEVKNLIVLKKAFYETNFNDEQKILNTIKPLLTKETIWKANALMLAGNYFISKGENLKAKDFFVQILNIKDLNNEIVDQANYQLRLIQND